MDSYDLLVIGGGINGLGIAADAAARGLSVLLVEKGDFGGGTSAASSRLIHGGLRYLQHGELGLVRESLRERGILARQRPHLVRPIDLLIPTFRGIPPAGWVVGVGLRLYDLLAHDPLFIRPRRLSPQEVAQREPGMAAEDRTGCYLYPDAQIEFPERLCVDLMRETRGAGGEALNHTRVTALRSEDGRVCGAALRDELTGEEWEVDARLTINAAGPWVDCVNRLLQDPPQPLIGGTWGSHVVLPLRPAGPRHYLYATAKKDRRPFFILPWDRRLLVGTTDVPFHGDPDDLRTQPWEPEYLLAETNRLFPGAQYTEADVQYTTVGIRPLPRGGREAGAITRRHFMVDHARRHEVRGLASIVGGKLTTYRSLAEDVVDWALRTLGRVPAPCPTRALPDSAGIEALRREVTAAAAALRVGAETAGRLLHIYGPRCREVLALAESRPDLAEPLYPGCEVLTAEVEHAVRAEGARTADDVLQRRLVLLPPPEEARRAVERLLP